jgi:Tol biopolymer transport system component
MKRPLFISILILAMTAVTRGQPVGSMYLNQPRPGLVAEVFAPNKVSLKGQYEYGSVFSSDGKEFYYAVIVNKKPQIRLSMLKDGKWTEPAVILASDRYEYNDPFLSPDGTKLFFISDRALDGQGDKKDFDIWYIDRRKDGWSEPVNAGRSINSDKNEYYMSFTTDGTMYFSSNGETKPPNEQNYDIYTSRFSGGGFQRSQKLGGSINSEHYEADVFVSPDEKYIIFCGERPDGFGKGDLFISFKDEKGQWQKAKNMGKEINTDQYEFCPFVSGDGKYLFFSRSGDIYWVSADIINTLR